MTHLPNGAPIVAIPEALRLRPQWVLWREEEKEGKPGEQTKVPYTYTRKKAHADKPTTWVPFAEALQSWHDNPDYWSGIGYEFGTKPAPSPTYTGIDFDNCLD